ncbi:MAG: sulfatase [Gemmatimonadota bacterium]|nr:sulfatase [Gemmatimonadota bacterium]
MHQDPTKSDVSQTETVPLFVLAAWFGMLAGLGETLLFAIKKLILNHFIDQSPWIIWMTPLADVILFLVVGLVLYVLSLRRPSLVGFREAVFVYAFLAFLALLLLSHQLHGVAKLFLAGGLAAVVTRFVAAVPRVGFQRFVRASAIAMVLLVVTMSGSLHIYQLVSERRALAGLGVAAAGLPNVLLLVLDTVRASSLGLYGYHRATTPNLRAFAEGGTVFTWAFSTAPWTLPSHASMLTGLYPYEHGADWQTALPRSAPSLTEHLRGHGYVTGSFVGNRFLGYEYGLDRGFIRVEAYPVTVSEVVRSASIGRRLFEPGSLLRRITGYQNVLGRKTAGDVNEAFLEWRESNPGRPFFALLNYIDAHVPYLAPSRFREVMGDTLERRNPMFQWGWEWSRNDIRAEMAAYDAAIAYVDHKVDRLLDELDARGDIDNTIVIITSDHGEQFGEHGHMQHSASLYLNSIHVPLIVHAPGRVPARRTVSSPVSLRDLPQTILDLAGLESSAFGGESLRRHWSMAPAPELLDQPILSEVTAGIRPPGYYPRARGDMQSLVLDRYHLIVNGDGQQELYDYIADPLEQNNLIASDSLVRVLERLRAALPGRVDD